LINCAETPRPPTENGSADLGQSRVVSQFARFLVVPAPLWNPTPWGFAIPALGECGVLQIFFVFEHKMSCLS